MIGDEAAARYLALIRAGDRGAREELIGLCLPLVDRVSRQLRRKHLGMDRRELWQEGAIGLMEAIDAWDPASGRPFSQYVERRIWRAEMLAIRDEYAGGIVLPVKARKHLMGVAREYKRLKGDLGREPTAEEVAASPGLAKELRQGSRRSAKFQVESALTVIRGMVELDATGRGWAPAPNAQSDRSMDEVERADARACLERSLMLLSPGQRRAVIEFANGSGRPRRVRRDTWRTLRGAAWLQGL